MYLDKSSSEASFSPGNLIRTGRELLVNIVNRKVVDPPHFPTHRLTQHGWAIQRE